MFNIVKNKYIFYIVSALVILAGIVSYFIRGGLLLISILPVVLSVLLKQENL